MKTILSVTGTRADYGIYVPVYRAIEACADLRLELAVVGMHLLPAFGNTVDEIEKDGFSIAARVATMTTEDTRQAMAEFVGRTVMEFASILQDKKPDLVLLLGDRGEQLAAAVAAVYLGIPVAQLHAGERSGSVDEPVRHAITQLATIHFTATEEYAENVRRMVPGNASHVHIVGAPAIDTILSGNFVSRKDLFAETSFAPEKPLVVFIQHPDTDESLPPKKQMEASLDALRSLDANILLLGSNADAGGGMMNDAFQAFASGEKNARFVISMPHHQYLSWMAAADVLVGNSSSGIIEAASFHVPVVNIGGRQRGRAQSGNVIDAVYDSVVIEAAIHAALEDKDFKKRVQKCQNVYGDGHSAKRIADILREFVSRV